MQIKTLLRYHLTPLRMAGIKKTRVNKCWQRYGEVEGGKVQKMGTEDMIKYALDEDDRGCRVDWTYLTYWTNHPTPDPRGGHM